MILQVIKFHNNVLYISNGFNLKSEFSTAIKLGPEKRNGN